MPKIKYYYRIVRIVPKGSGSQTDQFTFGSEQQAKIFVAGDAIVNPTAEYQLQTMISYE